MDSDLLAEQVSVLKERPALDAATAGAVRSFLSRLKGDYAPVDVLVFGSRARGDHHDESDIDVAVILEGTPGEIGRAHV